MRKLRKFTLNIFLEKIIEKENINQVVSYPKFNWKTARYNYKYSATT